MNGAGQPSEIGARRDHAAVLGGASAMRRHRNLIRIGLCVAVALGDMALIVVAAAFAAALRQGNLDSGNWLQAVGALMPAYLLAAVALGAYRLQGLQSFSRAASAVLAALVVAAAFGFCTAFALQVGSKFSRLETLYTLLTAFMLLLASRAVVARLVRGRLRALVQTNCAVLSDGSTRAEARANVQVIDVRGLSLAPSLDDPAFFARMAGLLRDTDRVVIAMEEGPQRRQWAAAMRLTGFDAEMVANLDGIQPLALAHWDGHATLVIARGPLNVGERVAKRAFDLGVTLALLPILGPVIAALVILVKLDSPGPAFFVQERLGRNNRPYRCWKLRTMRVDLTDTKGGVSASREDRRVTRVGKLLRRTSLDELPQLWNVLAGDMSLVGPRPHALGSRAEGALFWELVPDYWSRHSMKPGVTGLAQVRGLRGATNRRSDLEHRVAADLEYINSWSLWLDVKILVRTAVVLVHRNAY